MTSYYDGSSIQAYTYDAEDHMLTGGGSTYTYDANGQRVRKSAGSNYTEYVYFGGTPIAEKDQSGNWTDYIFAGGRRIAKATGTTSSGVTYYHADHLGSARLMTDSSGAVVRAVTYMPFGSESSSSGTDHYNFAGMEEDSETGFNHTQFRQQSPTMGRWMSPDPYNGSMDLTNPQSLNRYAYVLNNPLAWVDPDGLNQAPPNCIQQEDGTWITDAGKPCLSGWNETVDVGGGGSNDTLIPGDCADIAIGGFVIGNTCDIRNTILDLPGVTSFAQNQLAARDSGYYDCLAKENGVGGLKAIFTKTAGEIVKKTGEKILSSESATKLLAGAYYQYVVGDARFTNLGRSSRVLVPNLAPKFATAIEKGSTALALAQADYELAHSIAVCSSKITGGAE